MMTVATSPDVGSPLLESGSPAPCTDTTPLVTRSHAHVKVYKRRWYILLVFSLVAVLQGITTCH